jgi:nucleolar complex protein 2
MEQLRLLLFPLVQVIHGVITLVPTPRYFPLRLLCTQMLNNLAKSSRTSNTSVPTFLNTASYLLDVLQYSGFYKKPTPFSGKPPLLKHLLRIPDKVLGSRTFLNLIFPETYHQIVSYLALYSRSIAFPELAIPTAVLLRKFLKLCKTSEFTSKIKILLDSMTLSSRLVESQRNLVSFGPGSTKEVAAFLSRDRFPQDTPIEKLLIQVELQRERAEDLARQYAGKSSSPSARRDEENESVSSSELSDEEEVSDPAAIHDSAMALDDDSQESADSDLRNGDDELRPFKFEDFSSSDDLSHD